MDVTMESVATHQENFFTPCQNPNASSNPGFSGYRDQPPVIESSDSLELNLERRRRVFRKKRSGFSSDNKGHYRSVKEITAKQNTTGNYSVYLYF